MRNRPRFIILLAALIIIDAVLLQFLTVQLNLGSLIDRLVSLAGGVMGVALLARFALSPALQKYPAGFWPLVAVGLLLSYGIFAALAARAPHVQPLVHLAVAWIGAIAFGAFGFWRIGRWKD